LNKTIYFIRHGETDLNRAHIVQGSGVDSSLNELGRQQAGHFYDYYRNQRFDLVICSTLKRSYQTVLPFVDKEIPLLRFAEINEMNWGVHEGKSSTPEMKAAYDEMIGQWNLGNFDARLEEGESASEMADRIISFLDQLKQMPQKKILVCSHGRALRCIMTLLKGQHLREMESYKHSNTGLFLVKQEGQEFKVLLENDTRHLDGTK
jgi:Fructose-2,6-bisphosphatase